PDGRGSLTLNTTGLPARTFHFILSANSGKAGDNNAYLAQFDQKGTAAGTLRKQDQSALSSASLASSTFVFLTGGITTTQNATSTVGEFTTDSAGANVIGGTEDVNDDGIMNGGAGSSTPVSITGGTISSVDSNTGRATVTLTSGSTSNLVFYV